MPIRKNLSFDILLLEEEEQEEEHPVKPSSHGLGKSHKRRHRRNKSKNKMHGNLQPQKTEEQQQDSEVAVIGTSTVSCVRREDSTASAIFYGHGCDTDPDTTKSNGTVNQPLSPPPVATSHNDNDDEATIWNNIMSSAPEVELEASTSIGMSPLQYFLKEIDGGNSLRSTTTIGNDKKRERVYNTMFHVPWRCELLIDVGFFVCLDSFLSLLTIMPAKMFFVIWRCLFRQTKKLSADELSDLGCLIVLIFGVTILRLTDISIIYHFIRGQGTVKLYVVYNLLECCLHFYMDLFSMRMIEQVFDKLFQSFGGDVLQVLFNSAESLANSSKASFVSDFMRFILEQGIAVVAIIFHSFVILATAITLSAAIIAHSNALLALLVSNNFAEIKSSVFKRVSENNLHKMAYYDTVERFHIMAYILFVLGQNILEEKNPWFWKFVTNASLIFGCEILVDVIKHAFLAKFNEIKPSAYSDFLEDLCKQTLKSKKHEAQRALTFIPIAPACVVIRVFSPIYAAQLPYGPAWWRWFWIIVLVLATYFMLAASKILVGLGLQMHARWYVCRRLRKKQHLHFD